VTARLPAGRVAARRAAAGVTLVELMIALVLGILVAGAAISVFLATRQTYAATESMGRLQENGRVAFELLARDLREAASDSCGADLTDAVNVVNSPTARWYTDFAGGIRGFDGSTACPDAAFGTAAGQRVAGTGAVTMLSAQSDGVTILYDAAGVANPAAMKLNSEDHGFAAGDLAVACDATHAAIFQVTNAASGSSATITHNNGTGVATPGNCTKGLGSPLDCSSANGSAYQFGCAYGGTDASKDCTDDANKWSAYLAHLQAQRWYIGCNGRAACSGAAGRSLYRSRMYNNAGVPAVRNDEIVEGVTDLSASYLESGGTAYLSPSAVTDWSKVVAVDLTLQMSGLDLVDGAPLQQTLRNVVALRSRAP
jgi:type IV pilus assembly protein PilW